LKKKKKVKSLKRSRARNVHFHLACWKKLEKKKREKKKNKTKGSKLNVLLDKVEIH